MLLCTGREDLDANVAAKRAHMKDVQAAIAELKGDAAETKAQPDSTAAAATLISAPA